MIPRQLTFPNAGDIDTEVYLAYVLSVACDTDWVTRSMVKDAAPWLHSSSEIAYQQFRMKVPLKEEQKEKAKEILDWARQNLTRDGLTNYETSLGNIIVCDRIFKQETGMVASLLPYYCVAKWANQSHELFGTIGNRYDFGPLYLASSITFSSTWGSKRKYVLLDLNRRAFLWATTCSLDDGRVYSGRGTVKRFKSVGLGLITELTRCRLEGVSDSRLTTRDDFSKIWMIGEEGLII